MIKKLVKISLVLYLLAGTGFSSLMAQVPEDLTLNVCATTELLASDTTRTVVRIKWNSTPTTPLSLNYRFKAKNSAFWSFPPTAIPLTDTCIIDTIPTGSEREYQIAADTSGALFDYIKYGNILVGRKVPAILSYGRLLVLIDSAYVGAIDAALDVYKHDLIGDGFIPTFQYVSSTNSVTNIKQIIVNAYNITSSNLYGVVLLGHVPVPYAGDFDGTVGYGPPDGHTTTSAPPSHEGAWATDLYYGDMSASTFWTDATITNTAGARAANNNTIGDGKFDQTATPSVIEIPVGRVDLTDLPIFPESDTVLMIRYLTKNHNYRAGITSVTGRLLQDDELGSVTTGEPFGGNSFQIANPVWGDSVKKLNWNSNLQTNSYQWAQGFGFGSYTNCVNVVSSANFATNTYKATFTSLFGSYFGDFDITNNLLRSALASKGEILTTVWSGRPKWYFHQMATGNPIGLSVLRSQNTWNGFYLVYPDALYGAGLVHQSFHGDVTLKLLPYEKPDNFAIRQDSCNHRFILTWDEHSNPDVIGYALQRTDNLDSSFLDLVVSTTDTFYIDSFPNAGLNYYMVRAIKTQENCSGMHYNLSHGAIDSIERITEPPVFAGNDTAICENETVTLGTNFSYDTTLGFSWNPGLLVSDSSLQQPTWISSNLTQSFVLSVFDSSSFCTSKDTIEVTINLLPLDTIANPISNSCGDTISISSSETGAGKTYNWTFPSGTPATVNGIAQSGPHDVIWNMASSYNLLMRVTDNLTSCVKLDSISHSVACVLPVDLLNFEAFYQPNCKKIDVNWITSNEIDVDGFYLKLFSNGVLIGTHFIESKNQNSGSSTSYQQSVNVETSVDEVRLLELDNNNTLTTLVQKPVIQSICDLELNLYPNPYYAVSNEKVTLSGVKNLNEVSIYNAFGIKVISKKWDKNREKIVIDLQNKLSSGTYILKAGNKSLKLIVY